MISLVQNRISSFSFSLSCQETGLNNNYKEQLESLTYEIRQEKAEEKEISELFPKLDLNEYAKP